MEHLVLARGLLHDTHREVIEQALDDMAVVVVRLTAPPSVIEQRLRARDTGAVLAEHLAERQDFGRRVEAAVEFAVIANVGQEVRATSLQVLAAADWR